MILLNVKNNHIHEKNTVLQLTILWYVNLTIIFLTQLNSY